MFYHVEVCDKSANLANDVDGKKTESQPDRLPQVASPVYKLTRNGIAILKQFGDNVRPEEITWCSNSLLSNLHNRITGLDARDIPVTAPLAMFKGYRVIYGDESYGFYHTLKNHGSEFEGFLSYKDMIAASIAIMNNCYALKDDKKSRNARIDTCLILENGLYIPVTVIARSEQVRAQRFMSSFMLKSATHVSMYITHKKLYAP